MNFATTTPALQAHPGLMRRIDIKPTPPPPRGIVVAPGIRYAPGSGLDKLTASEHEARLARLRRERLAKKKADSLHRREWAEASPKGWRYIMRIIREYRADQANDRRLRAMYAAAKNAPTEAERDRLIGLYEAAEAADDDAWWERHEARNARRRAARRRRSNLPPASLN